MARIELTNVTAGGGGGSTTLALTTTGTSGAALLTAISGGYILNIPQYQGALTLTTTGSGAATLSGTTLNIPTPTSSTAAGSTGEVQYNGGSGAFAASPNLFWAAGTNRLGIGTSSPAQTLEVSGAMRLTGTAGTADFMLGRSSAGDVSTVTLGTTGTSGAATLAANVLNIPQYQGAVSLTTSGTSGASTFAANVLNIPQYKGALTLTTSGTSGAATLSGTTLNIPQYSGGGGTPAGSTGQIQFNNAGAFGASANLAWDNTNTRLSIGAPTTQTARFNVKSGGTLSSTYNTRLTNSADTEIFRINDDGSFTSASTFTCQGSILSTVFADRGNPSTTFLQYSGGRLTSWVSNTVSFISNSSGFYVGPDVTSFSFNCEIRGRNTSANNAAFVVRNSTPTTIQRIDNDGKISYLATNTAAGSTGPQTINQPSGTVNFAIGASALVVTNSLCTVNSIVFATVRTNDATAYIKNVVPAGGSFTINLGANATAETSVGFFIIN